MILLRRVFLWLFPPSPLYRATRVIHRRLLDGSLTLDPDPWVVRKLPEPEALD